MRRIVLMGVLLFAAPLLSQESSPRLDETKAQVAKVMGPPKMIGVLSDELESWQYEAEEMDEGEFSHYFLFGRKSGKVEAITRNFSSPRNVDWLFPASSTVVIELAEGYRARCAPGWTR